MNAPKREAGARKAERSEKGSGNTPKREAGKRSEKGSDIQTKGLNKTSKQQQTASVAAEDLQSFTALRTAGFDEGSARKLAVRAPEIVARQIEWLPRRGAKQNPLGLLRKAIEENWPEPIGRVATSQLAPDSPPSLFAKYFYAAFGRNTGEPTAEPSTGDLAAAEGYVERLVADWPNPDNAPRWGAAFGRLCLAHTEGKRPGIISFAAMLRSYGDEFIVRNLAAKRNELSTAREATAAAHERDLRPAWFEYVMSQEVDIQTAHPEAYAEFLELRREQRRQILTMPGENIKARALSFHDSVEGRLEAFRKFFAAEVVDFRVWAESQPTLTTV